MQTRDVVAHFYLVPDEQSKVVRPVLKVDTPEARELAELYSTVQDLKFSNECLRRLHDELTKGDDDQDSVLIRALWTSALVAYSRCFGTGRRSSLRRDDVSQVPLEGDVLEWHDFLIDLRNKHVAHSINAYEQMMVGVAVDDIGNVECVSAFVGTHIAVDEVGVRQTGQLTARLARILSDRVESMQDAVIEALRVAGPEALSSARGVELVVPGPVDVKRGRP